MPLPKKPITRKNVDEFSNDEIIQRIMKRTGKTKEEIIKLKNEKIANLGYTISEKGAICIIAKEFGIEIFTLIKDEEIEEVEDILFGK